MNQTDILEQPIYKAGSKAFSKTDSKCPSYWEDYENSNAPLLAQYEIEDLGDLNEVLSREYSADLVKRLLLMILHRQQADEVTYSAEELQNYTL